MLDKKKIKEKLEKERDELLAQMKDMGKLDSETGEWETTPEELEFPESDENDKADRFEDFEARSSMMRTLALRLNDILKALKETGYQKPTSIQLQAIPAVIQGKDVMAAAQTGTGKTAGFTLPILELLAKKERGREHPIRALILTPTRELAAQVAESVETYGKHVDLRSAVVFGGVKINPQITKLRRGIDILVATPGRLLDLHNQKAMRLYQL